MADTHAIGGVGGRRLAQIMGRVGIWSFALQRLAAADELPVAREMEHLGYPALWFPESIGSKDALAHAGLLLSATEKIVVAPGIANIHARDPMAMANGALALGDAYASRFVLGIGVSHKPSVEMRGGSYANPVEQMTAYLDAMQAAQYAAPAPAAPVPLVLAALGPRMLRLAAERADGAHPYFVPVEHTAFARSRLGTEPFLGVEMTAVLATDAGEARRIGRAFTSRYLDLPNYANNLRRLGWADSEITADGGSDRLVDALVAWGDVDTVAGRVNDHLAAGADHVCVQFRAEKSTDPQIGAYRELAAALAVTAPR